jgi:hypothetical protein
MTRIKHKLVEPKEAPSGCSDAVEIFARAGWAPADAQWLGELAYSVLRAANTDDELDFVAKHNLTVVADAAKLADPQTLRNRALLIAYVRLCECGGKTAQLSRRTVSGENATQQHPAARMGLETWRSIAKSFRSARNGLPGLNFEAALISGGWPGEYDADDGYVRQHAQGVFGHDVYRWPEFARLMHVLVDGAGLDLASVIDHESLAARGAERIITDTQLQLRVPPNIDRTRPPINECRSLTNWMIGIGPRALKLFAPVFQRCTNDRYLAAMAVGVQDAIERWLMCRLHHWTFFSEGGPTLADACQPYLEHLRGRANNAEPVDRQVRKSWLWFAWCVYSADRNLWQQLSPDLREQVLRAANEDLSRLRPLLSRARLKSSTQTGTQEGSGYLLPGETRAPWEEFKWEEAHVQTCVMLLYQFGGVWRGMKPLLLALRALGCPSVARDLRHWNEAVYVPRTDAPDELEQPPEPWAVIPGSMINLFQHCVGREQATDPELVGLRGELATFCLERLGDRWSKSERAKAEQAGIARTDEDMIERSPPWRLCLVRAVASLYINPEGKGHRALEVSSRIDPDADVRDAAHAAYEQMRRLKTMPENMSPRRAVMSALWWIRQAHLLELGIELDENGAQRTRVKELTRTKEFERANKLAMHS